MEVRLVTQASFSVLSFDGRIMSDADLVSANDLLSKISEWNVVLDLSKLAYTNSTGIAFFVKVLTRARLNQGDVVMLNVNEQLVKIFELTKINQVFQLVNTMSEVKAYFKK
jgi:anti-anti-sigma factor